MQPILFNHEEYLAKAMEHSELRLLQQISTKRAVRKRYFKNAMVHLGCSPLSTASFEMAPVVVSYAARDKKKRDLYLKAVKKLLEAETAEREHLESQ
jgi:hypothetical protein